MIILEKLRKKIKQFFKEDGPRVCLEGLEAGLILKYSKIKADAAKDLLRALQAENKDIKILNQLSLEELIKGLKPNKSQKVIEILEEDFGLDYQEFRRSGILDPGVLQVTDDLYEAFDSMGLIEMNEEDRQRRYELMAILNGFSNKSTNIYSKRTGE